MSYSHGSSDYYSSSKQAHRGKALPPIRDVLPDFFDGSHSHNHALAGRHMEEATHRSAYPPPMSHSSRSGHAVPHSSTAYQEPPRSYGHRQQRPQEQSDHEFRVLKRSEKGELLDHATSKNSHFPQRPVRSDQTDPSRRHECDQCRERFDRPSALETHMRTHNGERPFPCSYAGCQKTFAVKSNMRRHERTHYAPSQFEPAEGDEDKHARTDSGSSSGYYGTQGSSSSMPQPAYAKGAAKYYSSARR